MFIAGEKLHLAMIHTKWKLMESFKVVAESRESRVDSATKKKLLPRDSTQSNSTPYKIGLMLKPKIAGALSQARWKFRVKRKLHNDLTISCWHTAIILVLFEDLCQALILAHHTIFYVFYKWWIQEEILNKDSQITPKLPDILKNQNRDPLLTFNQKKGLIFTNFIQFLQFWCKSLLLLPINLSLCEFLYHNQIFEKTVLGCEAVCRKVCRHGREQGRYRMFLGMRKKMITLADGRNVGENSNNEFNLTNQTNFWSYFLK